MKLLFDENLSSKLPNRIADIFPNSAHIYAIGMTSMQDVAIWNYAKDNDFIIVSKDADMHDLSLMRGNPPKVIWIRVGNCSTRQVETLLRREFAAIELFSQDQHASLLALSSQEEWRSPKKVLNLI